MQITRLKLKNWRNFREVDVPLGPRTYIIGANASGKSNLLDVLRFMRTLAQAEGGGFQKALKERGGLTRLRSLHARTDPEVRIELELTDSSDTDDHWRYVLAFRSEGKGLHRVLVSEERVERNGEEIFCRPDKHDQKDPERLTQTHIEQIASNAKFRVLADHFSSTTYLHLVPQLLKHADEIGASRIPENDPFGQGLMQRIAKTPKKTRDARLRRIQESLAKAVPLFSDLRFEQDQVTGYWHLEANFTHWRTHGAWQRENQFSDGTLRLIGLLWALQEGDGLLLLEEPELSLNDGIVSHIPLLMDRVLRDRKKRSSSRQVVTSTHSETLLQHADGNALLIIEPSPNGSLVRSPNAIELNQIEHGLTPAEVLLPKTRPQGIAQLGLW